MLFNKDIKNFLIFTQYLSTIYLEVCIEVCMFVSNLKHKHMAPTPDMIDNTMWFYLSLIIIAIGVFIYKKNKTNGEKEKN